MLKRRSRNRGCARLLPILIIGACSHGNGGGFVHGRLPDIRKGDVVLTNRDRGATKFVRVGAVVDVALRPVSEFSPVGVSGAAHDVLVIVGPNKFRATTPGTARLGASRRCTGTNCTAPLAWYASVDVQATGP